MLGEVNFRFFVILAVLVWGQHAHAQQADTLGSEQQRLLEADNRSLLNAENNVGTYYATLRTADLERRDEREAPAQVQILTSRQLQAYGVRTLQEALMLVPGFSIALGRDQASGTAIHGNWAMEGKCLYLLDGKPLNENDFGTFVLGNRFSIANVERIEVMLSPGTVLHGGYAALGVVNIVTRSAENGAGSKVQLQSGYSNGGSSFTSASMSGAHRLNGQQDISFMAARTGGNRSNASYQLPDGTPVQLMDSTAFEANNFQFAYRWKSLKASAAFLEERRRVDWTGTSLLMRNVIFGLDQRLHLAERIDVDWHAEHADQTPWTYINTDAPERLASNTSSQRTSAQATLIYKPWDGLVLRLGGQGFRGISSYPWRGATGSLHFNGKPSITFNSMAWYAEAGWHNRIGDLLAGYRQEQHSVAGAFSAPRFAFSRVIGRFHGKLLWSRAYHMPSIMDLDRQQNGQGLSTGEITNMGAELGFRIGKSFRVTANVYRTAFGSIPSDQLDSLQQVNPSIGVSTGTEGVDARIQLETKHVSLMAGAGAYRPLPGRYLPSDLDAAEVAHAYQGLPNMRAVAAIGYEAAPWLSLRFRGQWQSGLWSWQTMQDGRTALVAWPEQVLLYGGFSLHPGKERRYSLDLACGNVLDTPQLLVAPAVDAGLPYWRNGREWQLGITYRFKQ